MAPAVVNFITTTFLTLVTGALLVVIYRTAVRPILVRHNVFPLRNLPSTISQHFDNRRNGIRLRDDDDLESAEQSFADYVDDPEEASARPAPYRDEDSEPRVHEERAPSGDLSQASVRDGQPADEGGLHMVGGALMGTSSR